MAQIKLRPKIWTTDELTNDAAAAVDRFRLERFEESLDVYTHHFDIYHHVALGIVPILEQLSFCDADAMAELIRDETSRRVLCYVTAPPISEDDLKTVAETTLSPTRIANDPVESDRLRDVICKLIDPRRFPWITEGREALEGELDAAALATASLIANSKVQTSRRTTAMKRQEQGVKDLLKSLGYEEIPVRHISSFGLAPKPKQFMAETIFFGGQGDVIAGLPDGRTLVVECKVSNSAINSRKRLVHDTGGKATIWYQNAGTASIIVAAVISGVFSVSNLEHVQADKGVFLFWDHRLSDLRDFLKSIH